MKPLTKAELPIYVPENKIGSGTSGVVYKVSFGGKGVFNLISRRSFEIISTGLRG